MALIDSGRNCSSVNVYDVGVDSCYRLSRAFAVEEKCGYIALSNDRKLLAAGVLKEDLTMIFDFETGELLINLRGGRKNGFFGQLEFINKTHLIELRVISADNRGPKSSGTQTRHNLTRTCHNLTRT